MSLAWGKASRERNGEFVLAVQRVTVCSCLERAKQMLAFQQGKYWSRNGDRGLEKPWFFPELAPASVSHQDGRPPSRNLPILSNH